MAQKKMTKAQAERGVKTNREKYREYVAAQTAKKKAKTKKEADAAQRKMDSLRAPYTAYRNAYRALLAFGGVSGKASAPKPPSKDGKGKAKGKGKSTRKRSAPKPKPAPEPDPDEASGVQVEA